MNQGKLDVVKQEMGRVTINILGANELKCMGMGEFDFIEPSFFFLIQQFPGLSQTPFTTPCLLSEICGFNEVLYAVLSLW